ncbi:hypothetical protein MPTK1_7g07490 [Marchantia polymorpha subsp. ruderalis]|uniref:Uncharacterized protein n=2 Tax=Marchantia polymorpha TaxID=3197 RepID=A0AAF6BX43_MARPO|nr:hypothetical protein MARPO_0076s0045 [Marchantia polymorpha]BBN16577.1 hypothetical protein Mp_7g07490 [Marchantia polymorpha subsp. ruderalis]|eukprot:PTQ34801.1 hypothetical protein MARPO_0076s0045 [Marchantia polymorpha]
MWRILLQLWRFSRPLFTHTFILLSVNMLILVQLGGQWCRNCDLSVGARQWRPGPGPRGCSDAIIAK